MLRSIAHETFGVGERDIWRGRLIISVVGDDFVTVVLLVTDARVGRRVANGG